ncbi:tetratricopeptide repeat protein [Tenacibaculum tangerinum]|uniref:Tetratricopeptide repeat protein n=1 Tax=Tenacibaculum tangerinum TaxID=3038772 RepID=A0ABY8L6Q3_9FLAO|nr:tetratricopeptide repeat-containing sensor histidine kinase [Tenacibaculum tangerinum]WGH76956.1 tetratricopeptide repeat protein [Tenacibaculum tangerinum]
MCHYQIGEIFRKINNHEKALFHFKKSLEIALINGGFNENNNILSKNEIKYAKSLLRAGYEFFRLQDLDSAKNYYSKIIDLNFHSTELENIKASAYNNLSGIYLHESSYKTAREYARKAIEIRRKYNNKIYEAAALGNLASIYLEEKKFNDAKSIYLSAINLIEKNTSDEAVRFKEDLYFNLAWALYKMKDYTAYDYQEKSYLIKDDRRDKEIRKTVEQVYAQQKVDLEKEKTALVEEQRKLEEAQEAKTSLLFAALSVLVLFVSGVVIYNYKLRQKNLRLKLSESKLLQQQNLEKVKSEAQVKILNATIDGKETERKLIAEILHDNVSALLSSANMHLTATRKQFNGETPQEIEKTQAIILEASQKVRDLSHNLVSSVLLKFGLEYAVKDVIKKYSNSQLQFEIDAQNINRYNQEFEIRIFNVIQELINNILKHSKANYAQIELKEEKDQLTILVKDDGVGFSASSSSFSDGIGLNQVEARVRMMNGKLTIKSGENVGTSIFVKVPILRKEKSTVLTSVG